MSLFVWNEPRKREERAGKQKKWLFTIKMLRMSSMTWWSQGEGPSWGVSLWS